MFNLVVSIGRMFFKLLIVTYCKSLVDAGKVAGEHAGFANVLET